jgi:hypothetical protein
LLAKSDYKNTDMYPKKINLLWAVIFVFALGLAKAQTKMDSKSPHKKNFRANITLLDGENMKVNINSIGDSSLRVVGEKMKYSFGRSFHKVPDSTILNREVYYYELRKINIRRIKQFKIWTGVGALTGGVIGFQIALSSDTDDLDAGILPIFLGIFIGCGIGAIIDASPKDFEIKGQYSNFQEFRNEMRKKE